MNFSSCWSFALASVALISLRADQSPYYWTSNPVDGSAQLLTLFCRSCKDSVADVPLVSVLSDNGRVTYLWLLTYTRPGWEKRALSAVPFFYWKVADNPPKVTKRDLKPLMNLSLPQRSIIPSTVRNVIQWTVLDPISMPVRASSRAYQSNSLDDERLHLEEAESYLQAAPIFSGGAALNEEQRNIIIARLELRKTMLGDFVGSRRAAEVAENANLEQERTRTRNWELLRQCADKTGLLFEPIDLAGAQSQYAVLWYPVDRSAPPEGTRLGPVWQLLNMSDPYPQRERLLNEPRYWRTLDGQPAQLVPLGVYSLVYPKMPLLMIDFRDGTHLKRHELTQRAINEITSGVIGLSHFANWYYFVGADLYDFYASRRGSAMNRQERLTCYSRFRFALALDQTLDPNLRVALQRRVDSFSVNPLQESTHTDLQVAAQRYNLLCAAAADLRSPLNRRLDRDRRAELARFNATNAQRLRADLLHYATFGLYTRRTK